MARGSKALGICELVVVLEGMLPLLQKVVEADKDLSADERMLMHRYLGAVRITQDLATRHLISRSLERGLERPDRLLELLQDYLSNGQAQPAVQAA